MEDVIWDSVISHIKRCGVHLPCSIWVDCCAWKLPLRSSFRYCFSSFFSFSVDGVTHFASFALLGQLNIANPFLGAMKVIEIDDEKKL